MTQLIALAGKAGYGKSTIAKIIKDLPNSEPSIVISFADPIREHLKVLYPQLTNDHFKDRRMKVTPIESLNGNTPRQLMITFGEMCCSIKSDVWVDAMESRIKQLKTKHNPFKRAFGYIIIDDLRKPNEVNLIRKLHGTIIHLERNEPEPSFIESIKTKFQKIHVTEVGIRHMQTQDDYVLNTSEHITRTIERIQQMNQQKFNTFYEI
jgi:hypothetical protein